MFDTILGIVIGIFTSLVAGVLLLWKQDQIAQWLKHLPEKRRINLYSLAYIRALRAYPFTLAHAQFIVFARLALMAAFLFYAVATFIVYFYEDGIGWLRPIHDAAKSNPKDTAFWLIIALRTITPLVTIWILKDLPSSLRRLLAELAVPYAHRELDRVRSCVLRVASARDYVAYTSAEHSVKNTEDLISLMRMAEKLLKDAQLPIIQEIIDGVSLKSKS